MVMKKINIFGVVALLLFLPSCSSKSKLPDDSIFVHSGALVQNLVAIYQTGGFYNLNGSVIKENDKYYFVDSNSIFHCSVREDTRIYNNDEFSKYTSNYEGIREGEECSIWVSYNISYDEDAHYKHKDDRLMCLDVSKIERTSEGDKTDYQSYGFYDHVLDVYYDCSINKIYEHNLEVTYEKHPQLKEN